MRSHRTVPTLLARRSIGAGVLVAVLSVLIGVPFGLSRPATYTAEAQTVVLPEAQLDANTSADYYETLSRGQIPATFAEVLNDASYVKRAKKVPGTATDERKSVKVDAAVVPNTALVSVKVTAERPGMAEAVANRLVRDAVKNTENLARPYVLSQVSTASGTAVQKGLTTGQYLLLSLFIGLLAGVAVQQLGVQIGLARGWGAARSTDDDDDFGPPSRPTPRLWSTEPSSTYLNGSANGYHPVGNGIGSR